MNKIVTLLAMLGVCLSLTACPASADQNTDGQWADARQVVAAGDSITWGGSPWARQRVPYPTALDALCGGECTVENAGHPGACLLYDGCQGYSRLMRQVLREDVWPTNPDTVIVSIGANDLGARLPTADLKRELRAIRADGARRGVEVLLATISPGRHFWPEDCEAQREELNAWIRTLPHVDFDAALANQNNQMRGRFNSGDDIHPSTAGYKSMAREAWRVLSADS